jgi:hypothetical protein
MWKKLRDYPFCFAWLLWRRILRKKSGAAGTPSGGKKPEVGGRRVPARAEYLG